MWHAEVEEGSALGHPVPHHIAMLLLLSGCPAIVMLVLVLVLGNLRAEVVLEVLNVERIGQFGELLVRLVAADALVVADREVEVDVLEVEQIAEVVVGSRPQRVKLLSTRPCYAAAVVHRMRAQRRGLRRAAAEEVRLEVGFSYTAPSAGLT